MADVLKVALVQAPLVWEDPQANRDAFSKRIADVDAQTDLIVLPEMFSTGFTMQPQAISSSEGAQTLRWMQEQATKKSLAITGSVAFKEGDEYFNRLFFVHPDGTYKRYDKRHTFTLAGEDQVYRAGEERLVVNYNGFEICPLICYDLRFPVWARNTEDYDVLLYVANWPKPRISAWDALLRARAIENMAYCIGVNRVGSDTNGHEYPGHSAVYDVLGERLTFSDKEAVLYATLSKMHINSNRKKLRFLEDRDDFIVK